MRDLGTTDFDLLVIGGGAAGLTAAVGGAGLGLQVALVERHRLGGECTWTGCVPSKALLHVAGLAHAARQAAALAGSPEEAGADDVAGGDTSPIVDFGRAIDHVRAAREEIGRSEDARALAARGVAVFEGQAVLRAPSAGSGDAAARTRGGPPGAGGTRPRTRHVVEVDGRPLTARHVVLATGSDPAFPPVPGLREANAFTNETLFDSLDTLPRRLAVVGGGPIGCEMAQAFARLGSRVTVIQSGPRLLPRDDPDAADTLRRILEREGVSVRTGVKVTRAVASGAAGAEVAGENASAAGTGGNGSAGGAAGDAGTGGAGGGGTTLEIEGADPVVADAVLVAAGRRPRTAGMGLEEAGVRVGRDGIEVDAYLQTSVPGVWAIGDCTGPYRFTHMADVQGRLVLRNILFPWRKRPVDYRVVPWTTFTDPEIGHVGQTEAEARAGAGGAKVEAVRLSLKRVDRAVTDGATDGFIKLVLRGQTMLGAQIVAPRAAEMVQEVALAMQRRLPVGALSMVHIYPAYSYGLHQANDEAWRQRATSGVTGRALGVLRRLALR